MQSAHDRYCDETHTPRQACNDALAPPELRSSAPIEPKIIEPQPAPLSSADDDPPMSSAVREAIAITQLAPPTPYVTREWERTAAAVADAARDPERDPAREEVSRVTGAIAWLAIVGLAAFTVLVFVRALRIRVRDSG